MDKNTIIMPFGKYKGQDIENVPDSYLLWMYEQGKAAWSPWLWKYLEENIEAIKHNLKQ